MAVRLLKIAAAYLLAGALLGAYMGFTQEFVLTPVHAHVLLLGWASLALAGLIYRAYPEAADTRLAQAHFWLHNLALPVFMLGLGALRSGHEAASGVVGISACVVILGLAALAFNVWVNVQPAR